MENSNVVSKTYCQEHERLIDERFRRDKEDIDKHDSAISDLKDLTKEISALVKQYDSTIKNHEKRLAEMEKRPSLWFDRIISAIIAAVISAIVALGGKV